MDFFEDEGGSVQAVITWCSISDTLITAVPSNGKVRIRSCCLSCVCVCVLRTMYNHIIFAVAKVESASERTLLEREKYSFRTYVALLRRLHALHASPFTERTYPRWEP